MGVFFSPGVNGLGQRKAPSHTPCRKCKRLRSLSAAKVRPTAVNPTKRSARAQVYFTAAIAKGSVGRYKSDFS